MDAREEVRVKLERRLSIRSDRSDLANRNILTEETPEAFRERRRSIRHSLSLRLSDRAPLEVLKERKILKFDAYAEVNETWGNDQYDRRADKPWTRLTPADKVCRQKNTFPRLVLHIQA